MRSLLVLALVTGTAAAQPVTRHPRPPMPPRARQAPTLRLDEVLASTIRGPVRAEQEAILVNLIAETPDSEVEEKGDYLFRLGELYTRQQQAFRDAGNAMKAKDALLKAVRIYKNLIDRDAFRNYPKLDVAMFDYAYTLHSARYLKEARDVFTKLVKQYPSSKYVPAAYAAFGDLFFDQANFADAEATYRKVLELPASNVQLYALYKLAWTLLATQREQDGVEMLARVAQANEPVVSDAARRDRGDAAYDYAERLWTDADREPDPKLRAAAWQLAAEAFQSATSPDPQRQRDIARAALLAWENALDIASPDPGPIDLAAAPRTKLAVRAIAGRDKELADACTAFIGVAPPTDPDLPAAKLLAALIDRRYDHADEAIVLLADLVTHHRTAATAEVAANLWLEQLLRLHRFDDALALVDRLAADTAFITTKPTLQNNIQLLRSRSMR